MTDKPRHGRTTRNTGPRRRQTLSRITVLAVCSALFSACHKGSTAPTATRIVSLGEFSRPSEEGATSRVSSADTPNAVPAAAAESRPAASTSTGDLVRGSSTAPAAPATSAEPAPAPAAAAASGRPLGPGDEVVVESVVGQVSGRPIFLDELLAPISDQLRREGERLDQAQFIQTARAIITNRLREVVLNELFLAEAEASLTPQERMGLLAFLQDMREKNIAERGGTIFGAQSKIAEEEQMTLAEFQEAQKNTALIGNLLYQRIQPRVIVSWRDVEREYERRRAEFNPPAQVTMVRLRLDNSTQKDLIEQVKSRLVAGGDFNETVQELALTEFVAPLGQGPLPMGPGGLSEVEGINEDYKPALAKLNAEAGQTTEAIELSGRTVWLHVEKIEQPQGRTIYQVQEQLIGELRAKRENEERSKYIASLFEKGIYDELDSMVRRVLPMVLLRYSTR